MQEERSHNRILLGSPQSLYVESVTETDIKISVKQPVDGWIVGEIKPEVTSSCSVCFCTLINRRINLIPLYLANNGLQVFGFLLSVGPKINL